MNLKYIFKTMGLVAIIAFFSSCKKEAKENGDKSIEITETNVVKSPESVYKYTKNHNEFTLSFVREGDAVTGVYHYHLNGRDENEGTVKGYFEGDLLILDYDFVAEAGASKRQVVFKIEGDAALEGYGDTEEIDGKIVFKDVNQLKYNPQFTLELVSQSGK